ncbi:hypothetical protein [Sinorhizobium psoraleae]|uniref:hypothetical protein n=1 Tax=Sinorhizobium psoraleae TaxID=520838 RepID=UPI0035E3D2BA
MTTDHISPAGQINAESYAGRHLVAAGDPRNDLNVYAARRGNWEAMVRGLFDNRTAANLLLGGRAASTTVYVPSMEEGPLWEVAERYRQEGRSVVVVAGERYGAGSSRDWAAKGIALLGVRAVIAKSFERIHRTNLVGMGVLPIVVENAMRSSSALDLIEVDARHIEPRCDIRLVLLHASGATETLTGRAAVETEQEVETLIAGGMIPLILDRHLAAQKRPSMF